MCKCVLKLSCPGIGLVKSASSIPIVLGSLTKSDISKEDTFSGLSDSLADWTSLHRSPKRRSLFSLARSDEAKDEAEADRFPVRGNGISA